MLLHMYTQSSIQLPELPEAGQGKFEARAFPALQGIWQVQRADRLLHLLLIALPRLRPMPPLCIPDHNAAHRFICLLLLQQGC